LPQIIPALQEYQRPSVPKFRFIDCAKCTVKNHRACGLPITQTLALATPDAGRWIGSAIGLIVVDGFWCGCRQIIPAAQEYQRPPVPGAGRWVGSAPGLIIVGRFCCGYRQFYSVYD